MQRANSLQSSRRSHRIPFLIVLSVVAADQLSKLWVRENLDLSQSRPAEGALRLTHVANEGGVFGISMPSSFSSVLSILVVITIIVLYYRYALPHSMLIKVASGLIVGGIIGNLIDRLRLGHVTDFVDLRLWGDYHWPAFNIADSAMVVGAILAVFFLFRFAKSSGYV